jgi:hypothetical protein
VEEADREDRLVKLEDDRDLLQDIVVVFMIITI